MQTFHVDITATAERDLHAIAAFIAQDSPLSATQWVETLEQKIHHLAFFPYRCSVIPETKELGREYRHLLLGPYRIIFRIQGSRVIILRVIHGAQLLEYLP